MNPAGRTEIVWDRVRIGFPSSIVEPEEIREMALALTVLAEIGEQWNEQYNQPIPEQMARIAAEGAAKK